MTQIEQLFPTLIAQRQWDDVTDFNRHLVAETEKLRAYDPEGIYRSNTAGTWHSKDVVLNSCGPAGEKLAEMFRQTFTDLAHSHNGSEGALYAFKMAAWAMRYTDRGYAAVHNHPNCHFSGVYYVDTGSDLEAEERIMATGANAPSGCLEFLDTRNINLMFPGVTLQPSARITPKAGMMVCFPSWLPHYVHPVVGEGHRLSIACNATLLDIKQKEADK